MGCKCMLHHLPSRMQQHLLDKFLISTDLEVTAIMHAMAAGELNEVRLMAHTLKSPARMMGAMLLGNLCEEIEMAVRMNDAQSCSIHVNELKAVFYRTQTAIRKHVESFSAHEVTA